MAKINLVEKQPEQEIKTPKKQNNKYILVVPNPFGYGDWKHSRRKVYFPIDKPEKKILEDIERYLKGNNFHRYELYRGREVML